MDVSARPRPHGAVPAAPARKASDGRAPVRGAPGNAKGGRAAAATGYTVRGCGSWGDYEFTALGVKAGLAAAAKGEGVRGGMSPSRLSRSLSGSLAGGSAAVGAAPAGGAKAAVVAGGGGAAGGAGGGTDMGEQAPPPQHGAIRKAMLRATSNEVTPIRPKHLRRLVLETYRDDAADGGGSRQAAALVLGDLSLRPVAKSPTVALKCLVVLHKLLQQGSADVLVALRSSLRGADASASRESIRGWLRECRAAWRPVGRDATGAAAYAAEGAVGDADIELAALVAPYAGFLDAKAAFHARFFAFENNYSFRPRRHAASAGQDSPLSIDAAESLLRILSHVVHALEILLSSLRRYRTARPEDEEDGEAALGVIELKLMAALPLLREADLLYDIAGYTLVNVARGVSAAGAPPPPLTPAELKRIQQAAGLFSRLHGELRDVFRRARAEIRLAGLEPPALSKAAPDVLGYLAGRVQVGARPLWQDGNGTQQKASPPLQAALFGEATSLTHGQAQQETAAAALTQVQAPDVGTPSQRAKEAFMTLPPEIKAGPPMPALPAPAGDHRRNRSANTELSALLSQGAVPGSTHAKQAPDSASTPDRVPKGTHQAQIQQSQAQLAQMLQAQLQMQVQQQPFHQEKQASARQQQQVPAQQNIPALAPPPAPQAAQNRASPFAPPPQWEPFETSSAGTPSGGSSPDRRISSSDAQRPPGWQTFTSSAQVSATVAGVRPPLPPNARVPAPPSASAGGTSPPHHAHSTGAAAPPPPFVQRPMLQQSRPPYGLAAQTTQAPSGAAGRGGSPGARTTAPEQVKQPHRRRSFSGGSAEEIMQQAAQNLLADMDETHRLSRAWSKDRRKSPPAGVMRSNAKAATGAAPTHPQVHPGTAARAAPKAQPEPKMGGSPDASAGTSAFAAVPPKVTRGLSMNEQRTLEQQRQLELAARATAERDLLDQLQTHMHTQNLDAEWAAAMYQTSPQPTVVPASSSAAGTFVINSNVNELGQPIAPRPPRVGDFEGPSGFVPLPAQYSIDFSELDIGRTIGRGAFGDVVTAQWRGQTVAMKRLQNVNAGRDSAVLDDFLREVNTLMQVRHPNVVEFKGACTTPPNLGIVMEHCEHGSLFHVLRQLRGRLPLPLAIKWATDIARGVLHLHTLDPPVLHRDLKSCNLLVDARFRVKTADFGLARTKASSVAFTQVGTWGWMAPEVLDSAPYNEKADVYSYGVILWELLTQEEPFKGLAPMQIMRLIDRGERPAIPAGVSAGYRELIEQCWATDPDARPTFDEVVERLEALARTLPMWQAPKLGTRGA